MQAPKALVLIAFVGSALLPVCYADEAPGYPPPPAIANAPAGPNQPQSTAPGHTTVEASPVSTTRTPRAASQTVAKANTSGNFPTFNETLKIAEEGYIFGLPLVMNYAVMYGAAVDSSSPQYTAQFNHIHNFHRLFTPNDTLVVTPNSDTPYSMIWMDLRAEPLVISVPKMESNRYYSCMLCDANTYNFGYIGTRTTGNEAGTFLVTGPNNWYTQIPTGIKKSYRSNSHFAFALFRTQLFSPDDMDRVIEIQKQYGVQTLSAYLQQSPPPAAPTIDFPPINASMARIPRNFFTYLDFLLPYLPTIYNKDVEVRRKLGRIGAGPEKAFDLTQLPTELMEAVNQGMALGAQKVTASIKNGTKSVNGWRMGVGGGDLGYYQGNWLKRAAIAQAGIYALDIEEAAYPITYVDSKGQPLDGHSKNYTLTFSNDTFPPVKAFWSVTMYDGETQFLVDNPINRYLINSPMLPSLVKNPDGGVTIYIQKQQPSQDVMPNWLPAPDGPIYLVLRLYLPKFPEFSSWRPPPVENVPS